MTLIAKSAKFVAFERLCETTATFSFTRPKGYSFRAGEAFSLTIPTRDGAQAHLFSHADAPGDDSVIVLTRLTGSAYKDGLLTLAPGDEVAIAGPMGRLTLGSDVTSAVFLVGGVGVSPAHSVVRDVALTGASTHLTIVNGNVDETCIPFREEFDALSLAHPNIELVHVLSAPSDAWEGERGLISAEIVRRRCSPLAGCHFYVCGPPAMVEAMRAVIDELEIPADLRHFELFAGYR